MELDEGHPVVLRPGEGEIVADRDRRTIVIKAAREEVTLTETRYAVGERGPDPHVHYRHVDAFYVLSGALVFRVGRELEPVRAEAGTLVLVPPGVVHTFMNEGPAEGTFLNIHVPDCGFAESLRGRPEGFDSYGPPEDGGLPASDVVVRPAGVGERIQSRTTITVKASAEDSDRRFTLLEAVAPTGYPGPSSHVHGDGIDSFYVLKGELELRVGDATARAGAGGFLLVPPGVLHTFTNPSAEPARFLSLSLPGGGEASLRDAAAAGR